MWYNYVNFDPVTHQQTLQQISSPKKKLFNKNNMKVSYSCNENIGTFIQRHNAKIISQPNNAAPTCNFRKKDCPLNGECQTTSAIYKCTITAPNVPTKTYIGLTEKEFKMRWNNYKQSINNRKYKNSTCYPCMSGKLR